MFISYWISAHLVGPNSSVVDAFWEQMHAELGGRDPNNDDQFFEGEYLPSYFDGMFYPSSLEV